MFKCDEDELTVDSIQDVAVTLLNTEERFCAVLVSFNRFVFVWEKRIQQQNFVEKSILIEQTDVQWL